MRYEYLQDSLPSYSFRASSVKRYCYYSSVAAVCQAPRGIVLILFTFVSLQRRARLPAVTGYGPSALSARYRSLKELKRTGSAVKTDAAAHGQHAVARTVTDIVGVGYGYVVPLADESQQRHELLRRCAGVIVAAEDESPDPAHERVLPYRGKIFAHRVRL